MGEGGLLEPLARVVVPVGQPVDDQAGAHRVGEVEGLDRQSLGRDGMPLTASADRVDHAEDGLEALGQSSSRRGAGR